MGLKISRILALAVVLAASLQATALAAGVTVFAAASLSDALTDVGKAYQAKGGTLPSLSYAASSFWRARLRRQAERTSSYPPIPIGWSIWILGA